MDTKFMINIAIEWAGLILCIACITLTAMEKRIHKTTSRYFILYFTVIILLIAGNMISQLCWDKTGAGWAGLARLSTFIMVFCSYIQALMVSLFLLDIVKGGPVYRRIRTLFIAVAGFQTAVLILNLFTGTLYQLDAGNHFHLGPLYQPISLLSGAMVVTDLIIVLRSRNRLSPGTFRDFLIYFVIPLIGMVIQFFAYGIYVMLASLILATTVVFISFLKRETERYYLQLQENEQMKTRLMLSQIQPHFLYNSLGVIQELCRRDPEKAEEATLRFSQFLRRNMDSLSMDRPIPFEDELKHTKNYLELEKMRFGDQLQVEYDIETTDFLIPTLTLQPLVENSVRHGIRQKEEGGRITIRVKDFPDRVEVRVRDDGPGIAPDSVTDPKESDRVGVRNVTERVRRMCGGERQLEFEPGVDAHAVITLPKKGEM